MNLMQKLFGMAPAQQQAPAQQAAPQVPVQPGNLPPQNQQPASATNPTAPASTVAATSNTPNNGAATPDVPQGLDKFNDMWNLSDAEKPKPVESAFAGVTPEAIQKIAGNTDFSKVVTPELLAKISAGGDEAAAAMMTALNLVGQQSYATSAEAAMKLAEAAAKKERENLLTELPNLIKQQTVSNNLRTKNPIFEHPAAAPMLKSLQEQLQLKNPTATPEQIQAKAEEFLVSFATAANPQKPQQQQANANKGTDFSDWV
jgi:hypothetical protein